MYDWAEFRYFRYLFTVLESRDFRAASGALHTTQSNLSNQAKRFQENAAVDLYRKNKYGHILPAETGVAFILLARFLSEARDEVVDDLIAIERGEISTVRFGCAPLVGRGVFHDSCETHKQLLPSCPIRLPLRDTGQLGEEVATGGIDAAIVALPIEHVDLRVEALRGDSLVLSLRKDNPLASKAALRPADLPDTVMHHNHRSPDAHERPELLRERSGCKSRSTREPPSVLTTSIRLEGQWVVLVRGSKRLRGAPQLNPSKAGSHAEQEPTRSQHTDCSYRAGRQFRSGLKKTGHFPAVAYEEGLVAGKEHRSEAVRQIDPKSGTDCGGQTLRSGVISFSQPC